MNKAKYFKKYEMVCHCCGQLPEPGISQVLLDKLDELRETIGEPIEASCMYRCPKHNKEVGGVPNSQHLQCKAADIYCPSMGILELLRAIREIGFDGVGVYSNFIHVDCRDNGESPNGYNWKGGY